MLLLAVLTPAIVIAWWCGWFALLPLDYAQRALDRRDIQQAKRHVRTADYLGGSEAETQFLLARIHRKLGEYDDMKLHLSLAEKSGLDKTRAQREHWLAMAQTGQLDEIEGKLNDWLAEQDRDMLEICEAYANGLAKLARFDDAEALLDAWERDFPDDPEPNYRRGRIREHQRQYEIAEQQYQAALAKDNKFYPAAYSVARISLDRKQPDVALEYFEVCMELEDNVAAIVGKARCLKALGRTDEASVLLRDALEARSEVWARSYKAVGENPHKAEAATELGKIELEAGNLQEAEKWLQLAVRENPRDLLARYAFANVLQRLNRTGEADREFERVRVAREALEHAGVLHDRIDRKPDDVESRFNLGRILLEYDLEQKGLYWLQSVLVYDPDHQPTHALLAHYFESHASESRHFRRLASRHRAMATN